MSFQVVKTASGSVNPPLPFSPATRAGGFVFVSGQASVDEAGKLVNDAFANQFHRTIKNVQAILAAAGLTLKDVCQVRAYLADIKDFAEFNQLYRTVFSEPYPARTTLSNCLPAEMLRLEIDVVAVDRPKN